MRADARENHDRIVATARKLFATGGAEASLRDVARTAGVGLGTLYRRFPTREALLDALLRERFDALAARADELNLASKPAAALTTWLGEVIAVANDYSGVIRVMVAAIDDEASPLHASCVAMKAAGFRLLLSAQAAGRARADIDGVDLFALVGAMAWLGDQPALGTRKERLFSIVMAAILVPPSKS